MLGPFPLVSRKFLPRFLCANSIELAYQKLRVFRIIEKIRKTSVFDHRTPISCSNQISLLHFNKLAAVRMSKSR